MARVPRHNSLGGRLWDAVERPQGYAFVSDALINTSDREVYAFLNAAIPQAKAVYERMVAIRDQYEQGIADQRDEGAHS